MPGPQSSVFLLLLVVAFAVAIWRAVVSRRVAFRILAGVLAFVPAMLFGVAAVNKYYDYYQTWGSAWADLFSQGPAAQVAAAQVRVQPPGPAWAVAGYSEGGFCAADLGLRFGRDYGYAGVLSGYFAPLPNQLGSPPRPVSPYGHDRALKHLDTPAYLVTALPGSRPVPQFWIGAGAGDRQDVASARYFAELLQIRQGPVPVHLIDGGGHSMFTWRGLVPSMLAWMTPRLARRGERDTALALAAARHARQKAEAKARAAAAAASRHHRHHHHRGDRRRP